MSKQYEVTEILKLPGEGEIVGEMTFKVDADDIGGTFSVMENVLEPKTMIPPHQHQDEYQAVYVISGELEFEVGGEDGLHFTAPAGSYMWKPRRLEHGFWNPSETEPARYIELSAGYSFQDFIRDTADGDPAELMLAEAIHQTKFNYRRTKELMDEHGLTADGSEGFPTPAGDELPTG